MSPQDVLALAGESLMGHTWATYLDAVLVAVPLSVIVLVVVSLLTPPPDEAHARAL